METVEATRPDLRMTRPVLFWRDLEGRDHTRDLSNEVSIGASPHCEVHVVAPGVSRIHAALSVREGVTWLTDLGSRNGTFVGQLRIERAGLPPGTSFRIGPFQFELREEETQRPLDAPATTFGGMLGRTPAMQAMFRLLAMAAASDAGVLIQAETGCGKELVAHALHEESPRAQGPLVTVDCAALPETLLESELFGHSKGAFTGASGVRIGAFESAHQGTIFLDEIGELPAAMQPKLLRVLESRAVRRIGETHYRPIDVRVVAATHRDLRTMVNQGAFREDLYFRLAVLPVSIPPLRQRADDIPLLLEGFLGKSPREMFDPRALAMLAKHPWLGNVRELRNFADRARALGPELAMQLLVGAEDAALAVLTTEATEATEATTEPLDVRVQSLHAYRDRALADAELRYMRALLAEHKDNISEAARVAGVTRSHIYRLIKRYDL